jgi:hypothetical protein
LLSFSVLALAVCAAVGDFHDWNEIATRAGAGVRGGRFGAVSWWPRGPVSWRAGMAAIHDGTLLEIGVLGLNGEDR